MSLQVELHRHLEGSIRFDTLIAEYKRQNAASSRVIGEYEKSFRTQEEDQNTWRNMFLAEQRVTDLTAFLAKFGHTQKLLSSEEFIEQITYESCEDAYRDGTRLLELRYSPQYIQNSRMPVDLSFNAIHGAILRGIHRAEQAFDMSVGLIGILDRSLSFSSASETLDFILQHQSSFVALDLANDELLFDSDQFVPLFRRAKQAGLGITVHAGEYLSPKFARNVKKAIDDMGAQRIGHGVGIITDESVLNYVKEKGVLLEVCPSSNYLINVVPSFGDHPVKRLLDRGVKISISTDDPGLFGIDMKHEYAALQSHLNFSGEDLDRCNQMGFECSFLPEKEKAHLLKEQERLMRNATDHQP
eukprot:TRINITY_DN3797_c0_g2_i1.p1 TRINITY_DN3797_c0_g2~~TRINITY_DN3797_c0_g2_i1.p1  ORF type:complete len:358 (-),score=60.38 TRINITY_DN3797_c0_g2_i1:73-1146(-)